MTSFSGPFIVPQPLISCQNKLYYDQGEVLDQYLGTGEPLRV